MIGTLDFFHTDSECSEREDPLALESVTSKSGFKCWSCNLLNILSQSNFISFMRRKAYIGHTDKGQRICHA